MKFVMRGPLTYVAVWTSTLQNGEGHYFREKLKTMPLPVLFFSS